MNLLLLLSALLSALGGMGQAVCGGGRTEAVCAVARDVQAAPVRRTATAIRLPIALPRARIALAIEGTALVLSPPVPLYAARRRE